MEYEPDMADKPRNLIHIGTSGWHYKHWKGPFYPADMADERLLEYYLRYFDTTEINNTFYQLPEDTEGQQTEIRTTGGGKRV